MRINLFVARATGLSRRAADRAVESGRVTVNGRPATLGQTVSAGDNVALEGKRLDLSATDTRLTIMLNKPTGYVVSRAGQGSRTVYDLLPPEYQNLKPVGRLDKDSSGLLLLTNDGELANRFTHPSFQKEKVYEVALDKPLTLEDSARIEQGIKVEDYVSRLRLKHLQRNQWQVIMSEGRNRQIRRTFAALGYAVTKLHRTKFGSYSLDSLANGKHKIV